MTSINAGFSKFNKHPIICEELIYVFVLFLEMKNKGMRKKRTRDDTHVAGAIVLRFRGLTCYEV